MNPISPGISIVLGHTERHIDAIAEMEQECFVTPWSRSAIDFELKHKYTICLIATDEHEKVIGYVTMRHIINEGHINNLAVRTTFRRQGVASLLVNGLIEAALAREMIGITLEVRVSNYAAINLYKKHGFTEEGRRKNYYASPSEDAIIMWKHF